MFGYIKPYKPELKVRQEELYRAVYCGLCRAEGRLTGQASRLALSYDATCFAIMRMVLSDEKVTLARRSCAKHIGAKHTVCEESEAIELAAYVSALLMKHKLDDDICDGRGARVFKAKMARSFFGGAYKRARRAEEELDNIISEGIERLSEVERDAECSSVDRPAEIFGELFGRLLAYGYVDERERIAYSLGRHIGRWIYMTDALDDLRRDAERGEYNPIFKLYGHSELLEDERTTVVCGMLSELDMAAAALDLIDTEEASDARAILENIITLSLPAITNAVADGKYNRVKRQKEN